MTDRTSTWRDLVRDLAADRPVASERIAAALELEGATPEQLGAAVAELQRQQRSRRRRRTGRSEDTEPEHDAGQARPGGEPEPAGSENTMTTLEDPPGPTAIEALPARLQRAREQRRAEARREYWAAARAVVAGEDLAVGKLEKILDAHGVNEQQFAADVADLQRAETLRAEADQLGQRTQDLRAALAAERRNEQEFADMARKLREENDRLKRESGRLSILKTSAEHAGRELSRLEHRILEREQPAAAAAAAARQARIGEIMSRLTALLHEMRTLATLPTERSHPGPAHATSVAFFTELRAKEQPRLDAEFAELRAELRALGGCWIPAEMQGPAPFLAWLANVRREQEAQR